MGDLSPERQADKRIAAQLVRAAGGVEAAAGFCRLGKSQLSDVGNVNISDKFMPLDVIDDECAQLERLTCAVREVATNPIAMMGEGFAG